VLQEFYTVAVSKKHLQMTHEEAVAVLQSLAAFPVCPITSELVMEAIQFRQGYQLSYWDAAILVAAKRMSCTIVYSEDLNPGQVYNGVTVINPFVTVTP
jgi:predicted nucleic acid-binding protein